MDNSIIGVIILAIVVVIAVAIAIGKTSKVESPPEDYGIRQDAESMGLDLKEVISDELRAKAKKHAELEERVKNAELRNENYVELSKAKALADSLSGPKYRITRNLESLKYIIEEAIYSPNAYIMDICDERVYDYYDYGVPIKEAEHILDEWETKEPLGSVYVDWKKILYEYDTYQTAEEVLATFISMETEDTTAVKYYDNAANRV